MITPRRAAAALAAIAAACAVAVPAHATRTDGPTAHASIVNGYVPHSSQWPWTTALLYSPEFKPQNTTDFERQFCGGTLVRPKVVVTAAHCIVTTGVRGPTDLDVLLGRRNLDESVGEKIDVAQVVVHPQYNPDTQRNDVAILHLATPSTMTPATVIDPRTRLKEGRRATVMGWGALGNSASYGPLLRAADVPLWSPKRCRRAYRGQYDGRTMVCAGYLNGKVDSCQGDSGGPLMVLDSQRRWFLLGVVSFGNKCALPQFPGVYAWVNGPGIRQFIQAEMAKDTSPPGSGVPAETPGAQPTQPPADDARAPRIGNVRLSGSRRALAARFALSEPAQLTATVYRGSRKVRGPAARGARSGTAKIAVKGRLRPGSYRLVVTATDLALNRSARAVRFRVSG